MVYLFYHSWKNTSSNHAGMKYMCEKLEQMFPDKYKAIEIAREETSKHRTNIIYRGLNFTIRHILKFSKRKKNFKLISSLNLQKTDSIILTEYMDRNVGQIQIAETARWACPSIKIFGLSHLVPSKLDTQFNDEELTLWKNKIDGLITLGSSLTDYYVKRGFERNKILTAFHYLDDYYMVSKIRENNDFVVLAQGNQMRDLDTLASIIQDNPRTKFIVCQGVLDLSSKLGFPNVELKPYVEEDELRNLMLNCPVSINVMHDTIGSNVIVTSLGMGEAMICSDVGSIRNYCSKDNCYFCTSVKEFSGAIQALQSNKDLLLQKRMSSLHLAQKFKIENFEKELYNFICSTQLQ